jgi:hypothetical protein
MPLPPFLLRLLLCMTLVLNGSGYAVAATQMQLLQVARAEQANRLATEVVHDAPAPCHSQVGQKEPAPAMSHDAVKSGSSASQHGSPDDCQTLCSCDCLQHASLAMTELVPPTAERLNTPSTRRIPAGHAAPVLANLIRPPIG